MKKGLVILMAASGIIAAAPKNEPVERIRGAAEVFNEIQGTKDKGVPDALLSKAKGIIIVSRTEAGRIRGRR